MASKRSVRSRRMLHREETGSGPWLVTVHGAWADGRHWTRLATELASDFRVVTYDRRGHGRSGGSHGTIDDDARDLLELIGGLGEPAHVVGGSLGGTIALRAAATDATPFTSLAVHEPALPGLLGRAPEAPERIPTPREFAEASLGEGWWDGLTDDERTGFEDNGDVWAAEIGDPTAAAELGPLSLPLLVTVGGASPEFWWKIVEGLPATEVRTIDGAGHLPQLTHVHEYARVLREFVATALKI